MHRQKHLPWFLTLQLALEVNFSSLTMFTVSVLQHAFTTGKGLAHEKQAGT